MKARGHEADFDGGEGGSQPDIPAPKFRHFARLSQACTFLKKRLSEKYKSSVREIPDLGYADFQRARATTPPVRNRPEYRQLATTASVRFCVTNSSLYIDDANCAIDVERRVRHVEAHARGCGELPVF